MYLMPYYAVAAKKPKKKKKNEFIVNFFFLVFFPYMSRAFVYACFTSRLPIKRILLTSWV